MFLISQAHVLSWSMKISKRFSLLENGEFSDIQTNPQTSLGPENKLKYQNLKHQNEGTRIWWECTVCENELKNSRAVLPKLNARLCS